MYLDELSKEDGGNMINIISLAMLQGMSYQS